MVLVALPDPMFDDTFAEIKKKYPKCSFKKVECDLGDSSGSYLKVIEAATARLNIQILFNNAGYIKWGFFVKTSLGSQVIKRSTGDNLTPCALAVTRVS